MKKTNIEIQEKVKLLANQGVKIIEISRLLTLGRGTIRTIINNKYKEVKPKTNVNLEIFKNLENRDLNYFLGLLATDGSIYKNRVELGLKESDIEIINIYKHFLGNKVNISKGSKKMNNKIFYNYKIAFRSKEISDQLFQYGITPRKSLTLNLNIPINWDILRGIVDGDGCFIIPTKGSCRINIISGSELFINQIKDFLSINDINCRISNIQRKNTYYILNINKQKDIVKVINNLYNNTHTFIKRKYDSAEQMRNHLIKRLETQGTSIKNPEASQ